MSTNRNENLMKQNETEVRLTKNQLMNHSASSGKNHLADKIIPEVVSEVIGVAALQAESKPVAAPQAIDNDEGQSMPAGRLYKDELRSQPSIAKRKKSSKSSKSVTELPVRSATRRRNDMKSLDGNISDYFQSIINLRDRYANRLYFLLFFEIIVMFLFVGLYGFEIMKLEPWLVAVVAETILAKTFLTVQIIVKNLFPNKNLLEMIVEGREK